MLWSGRPPALGNRPESASGKTLSSGDRAEPRLWGGGSPIFGPVAGCPVAWARLASFSRCNAWDAGGSRGTRRRRRHHGKKWKAEPAEGSRPPWGQVVMRWDLKPPGGRWNRLAAGIAEQIQGTGEQSRSPLGQGTATGRQEARSRRDGRCGSSIGLPWFMDCAFRSSATGPFVRESMPHAATVDTCGNANMGPGRAVNPRSPARKRDSAIGYDFPIGAEAFALPGRPECGIRGNPEHEIGVLPWLAVPNCRGDPGSGDPG